MGTEYKYKYKCPLVYDAIRRKDGNQVVLNQEKKRKEKRYCNDM